MTSPRVAVLAALLLASPAFSKDLPDAAAYEQSYNAFRQKAKAHDDKRTALRLEGPGSDPDAP